VAHEVTFHRLARDDLFHLYSYIEERSGAQVAGGYLERIEALCTSLASFPERGVDRSDLAPHVRTMALERRVLVVYRTASDKVEILRILYAGRDLATEDVPR
jgi:toxin ParE1/3/4